MIFAILSVYAAAGGCAAAQEFGRRGENRYG
jgi:hypothetical protein